MKRFFLFLFITVWCIYYLQGALYAAGSRLALVSLLLGLVLCVAGWFSAYHSYKMPSMLNTTSLMLVMFAAYGFFLVLSGKQIYRSFDQFHLTGVRYITSVFSSLSPVFITYYFTKKGILKERHLQFLFLVFLVICISRFWGYERARILMSEFDTDGMATNNIAYDFLGLLPMVCLFNRKSSLQYLSLIVILFFVIYSVKRGAILITFICAAIFIFKSLSRKSSRSMVFLSILAIAGAYLFIDYMITNNAYFVSRLESTFEGDDSGRGEYYALLINYLKSIDSIPRMLFGGGAYHTVEINGNLAHNDWLEILVCNGLLGLTIFAVYWIRFYKTTREAKGMDIYLPLLLLFVSMFLKTLFSMSYSSTPFFASFYLGYCVAQLNNQKNGVVSA